MARENDDGDHGLGRQNVDIKALIHVFGGIVRLRKQIRTSRTLTALTLLSFSWQEMIMMSMDGHAVRE